MKIKILLGILLITFVSAKRLRKKDIFSEKKVSQRIRTKNFKNFKRQLKNINKLRRWKEENHLDDKLCFIHIPRTGGLSFRSAAKKMNLTLDVWHKATKQPSLKCGCITNIRDPVKRYISEWKFYGMNYFAKKRRLFGWQPASGFTQSYDEYVNDTSTHNAMTKILSGCQMYSNCDVDEDDVQKIVDRVKSDCLTIMKTESMPLHAHHAIYEDDQNDWVERATKANQWDIKLYDAIKDI